jgi:hypothetical protein
MQAKDLVHTTVLSISLTILARDPFVPDSYRLERRGGVNRDAD